jgi:hypothetical protein
VLDLDFLELPLGLDLPLDLVPFLVDDLPLELVPFDVTPLLVLVLAYEFAGAGVG